MSFSNIYTHRKVAETATKGCEICFKPTSSVLITPDNKDFFYICPNHLKDRTFCTPIIDKEAAEAKKKKEEEEKEKAVKEEIERVKKEYDEKQKKKKEKEKAKDKDKEKEKGKEKEKDKNDKDKDSKTEGEKKTDDASKEAEKAETSPAVEEQPRVFSLQKFVYQQRLEKRRQAEMARRNRERLNNPGLFPAVPKNLP